GEMNIKNKCGKRSKVTRSHTGYLHLRKVGLHWLKKLSPRELICLSTAESSRSSNTSAASMKFGTAGSANHHPAHEQKAIWKQKSYGTTGAKEVEVGKATISQTEVGNIRNGTQIVSEGKKSSDLSKLFKGKILANFAVDNSTYSLAQIRAKFYPKFENKKSDQEVRTRMIETVSKGLATMEFSLEHSGSLFMYVGHAGGAYAKNSYGNMYAQDT
ncbi:hypothetical protein RJ639_041582, partial [Escallonia herrerae]